MILEAIYNGEFYPSEKVVPTSPAYIEALKTCEKLMEQLSRRLSKEDYALVKNFKPSPLSPRARRASAISSTASQRGCWCSRKRWSRSRRSMTNETAAGVHYLFCQKIAKQHENMV